MSKRLEAFTQAYVAAALWSSIDDDGVPLDRKHDVTDIDDATLDRMKADCARFYAAHTDHFAAYDQTARSAEWSSDDLAGHDFWLTRNGHGAGFWDRDLGAIGELLTREAKAFGEFNLYIGDDGKIYGA